MKRSLDIPVSKCHKKRIENKDTELGKYIRVLYASLGIKSKAIHQNTHVNDTSYNNGNNMFEIIKLTHDNVIFFLYMCI